MIRVSGDGSGKFDATLTLRSPRGKVRCLTFLTL
jgi:hypothetical protein